MRAVLMKRLPLAIVALLMATWVQPAFALEFRKCTYKIMVSANGFQPFEFRQGRMTVWARTGSSAESNSAITKVTNKCVREHILTDQVAMGRCGASAKSQLLLNTGSEKGYGVSGFQLTRGFLQLRAEVCSRFKPKTPGLRTISDIRKLDGFTVYMTNHGGTGRCQSLTAYPASLLTLDCKNPNYRNRMMDGFNTKWYYHP